MLLLRQVDRRIGLTRQAAAALRDSRDRKRIHHELRDLLAQRIYGLCQGYEDLNDHDRLRRDTLMQTAVGVMQPLASSPTLCRLETAANRAQAVALHRVLVEQFIARFEVAPTELVLDLDASDVPLHGEQELREFHGYYDHHCYLPLYVFCGQAMLACLLRPSKIDAAKHAAALVKLLVGRLRQAWPAVRLIVRADSGFCRQRLIRWCERNGVGYLIGLARNGCLHQAVAEDEVRLEAAFEKTGAKQRWIGGVGLCRPVLEPGAAGDHPPGVWRAGDQSPLRGDQHGRRGGLPLRHLLLRPWRGDTIVLPKALETRLAKAAAKAHASPEQLARKAIAAHLDYLDWREKAIRAGFASGEAEGWNSTDEVFAAVAAQRARRAGKQAA